MKKHYETHVEDTDKLISVAGPIFWYEQYRKLMEEQAQRKYGLYTPTSEGDDDDFPSITGITARYSALGLTNEQMAENPVWKDLTGNGHDLQMKNFAWGGMSGIGGYVVDIDEWGTNSTAAYFERNSIKITATFKENASCGIKGLNAVCSDGRVYDCNWNEISVKYGNMVDINSSFLIANSGNIFTKMAFKNLGIYNNQLLSKDDCIKAYNYLQTLKAK